MSQKELRDAFAQAWQIEPPEPSRFEVRPDLKDLKFSEGGPKAWFATIVGQLRLTDCKRATNVRHSLTYGT